MKNAAICLLALVSSASAFAAGPVVYKSSGAGFVPPQYQRSESCELHADKVIIERNFAGLRTREERPLQITGNLAQMIELAAQEAVLESANMLCDAPATSVYAKVDADFEEDALVALFITGGCGTPRQERQGAYASALRNMIDEYCPTTHDYRNLGDHN